MLKMVQTYLSSPKRISSFEILACHQNGFSESCAHLLQPGSHKSNVHFAVEVDSRDHLKLPTHQRTISPLPISSAMKYKSDSNPNLFLTSVAPVPSVHTSNSLIGHSILSVDIFHKEILKDLFHIAEFLRNAVRRERPLDHILRVKNCSLLRHRVHIHRYS